MDLTAIFSTYPGVHVIQAFFHSLTAAIIAGRSVAAWDIRNPVIRQKFYLAAVFLPILCYPLYQLVSPDRGSIHFRLHALFDSGRWLGLELWGFLPAVLLLLAVLLVTSTVFVIQELIPILRHRPGPEDPVEDPVPVSPGSAAAQAVAGLADETPSVMVVDDDEPGIHSVTRRRPIIYLTTGLLRRLQPDELRAAFAHEVAHIRRSRRPLLIVAYIARVVLFFSPGTLVAFRRAAAEEEKICDDWAVATTGEPEVLARVLEKLRDPGHEAQEEHALSDAMRSMERMSYDLMVQERIQRLSAGPDSATQRAEWFKFGLTVLAMLVVNYYVV